MGLSFLILITLWLPEKLIGQNDLYACAVKEASTSEIIVKLVNTASSAKTINFNINGVKIGKKAEL